MKFVILRSTLLAASMAVSGLAAPAPAAGGGAPKTTSVLDTLFEDTVVARGKGFEIRQSELDQIFAAYRSERATTGQATPESARPQIEAGIVSELIVVRLCLQQAIEADREAAKKITDDFLAEQRKKAASEQSFQVQLRARGLTLEDLKKKVYEQAILKVVLDRELRSKQTVTDEAAAQFYKDKPDLFQSADTVRVAHILISTRVPDNSTELPPEVKLRKSRLAEKVQTLAKAGADFSNLVKEYSEDIVAKARQGEYTITRNERRYLLPPEFEGAAFSLATNQVSEVFSSAFGYHIIKCLEKKPPSTIPYAEVTDRIKETLIHEAVQKELPAYIEALKKQANVEILKPGLAQSARETPSAKSQ